MLENQAVQVPNLLVVDEPLGRLVQLTTRLFGGQAFVIQSRDPEFPADRYLVIVAPTSLSPQAIVAAEQKWIEAVRAIMPELDSLRLSIRPESDRRRAAV